MNLHTLTPHQVKDLLADEELFDRISDDHCSYERFFPPSDHLYIGCADGGILLGFFWLHPETSTTLQIHANFKKEHRGRAGECAQKILEYLFRTVGIEKLTAKIPVTFQDVYHFTKRQGLVDEGCDRKSILKGGKLIDRYCLGLTREDYLNGCS